MAHIIFMKKVFKSFMGLLLLVSVVEGAEETLAERKERIMRKYLRERTDIVASGLTVDTGSINDEQVKSSEMMQVEDLEFERHEGRVAVPPPRQVPRPLPNQQDAWWMTSEEEVEESSPASEEYWSMFGVSEEERGSSYQKRLEEYEMRERGERKDIFGVRAPTEPAREGTSYWNGSERVDNPWEANRNTASGIMTPSYKTFREANDTERFRESTRDRSSFSVERSTTLGEPYRPTRNVMPFSPPEEPFVRPSYKPVPRGQIQRESPTLDNRDLNQFLDKNR